MPNYPSDEEIDDLAEKISDILVSKRTGTFVLSIIMSVLISYPGLFAMYKVIPAMTSLSYFIRFCIYLLELYCLISVLFFYWKTVSSSPGYESELPHQSDLESTKSGFYYCTLCELFVHNSSYHCDTCGQCVLNGDHHCFWISNCVGFRNVRYFVLFLYYGAFYLFMTALVASWYVFLNSQITDSIMLDMLLGYCLSPMLFFIGKECAKTDYSMSNSALKIARMKLGRKWMLPIPFSPAWSDS